MSRMDQTEALAIVEEHRANYGLRGTLEAMQDMQLLNSRDRLTDRERQGFQVAFDGFRRLFFGDA